MTAMQFRNFLRDSIVEKQNMPAHAMTERDWNAVEAIRRERYASWEWNYGRSPDYSIVKRRRLPGFGEIRISMQVENGRIEAFATTGDYFGNRPSTEIGAMLLHTNLEESALQEALSNVRFEEFYESLSCDEFIQLILK
jgi:lipoate---protein ligase